MGDNKFKDENMVPVATTTRSVVESYIFATGHQDLSIYSERLLMLLVRAAQCQVNGLNFRDGSSIAQVNIGPLGDAVVEIEARELLTGDKNNNYTQAKNAVLELMKKPISHERPAIKNGKPVMDEAGNPVYEFEAHNLLNDVYINKKPGVIIVNVNKTTWEAILDFSKGFRRYDLQVAMQFSRTCSLRMFKLISNQKYPLSFSIQELREQWGLTNKYKSTKDFIKYTIDSAKEELDKSSPWTFDYIPRYSNTAEENKGRVGRKSITGITFYPKHVVKFERTSTVMTMLSPSAILGKVITDRLVKTLGFSMAEIKANLTLFDTANKAFDLEGFLIQIGPKANRAINPQGYVINAIKIHLKEKFGIVIKRDAIVAPESEVGGKLKSAEIRTPSQQPSLEGKTEEEQLEILKAIRDQQQEQRARQQEQRSSRSGEPSSIGDILGLFSEDNR